MAFLVIRQMAYDEYPPLFFALIFFEGMFHFTSHEWLWVLFEDAQTGVGAEINAFALIQGTGVICRIFEFASAGRFVFRCLICRESLSQVAVLQVDLLGTKEYGARYYLAPYHIKNMKL